jgi:hypothetical protein
MIFTLCGIFYGNYIYMKINRSNNF